VRYKVAILLFAAMTIGCSSVTVKSGQRAGVRSKTTHVQNNLFWGLVRMSRPVDLKATCSEGWSEVNSRVPAWMLGVWVITAGLYSPWEVTVTCRAQKKS